MQRRQDVLANNLANINTPGYKQDDGVLRAFPEQLLSRMRDPEGPTVDGMPNFSGQPAVIGRLNSGVYLSEALPNFSQGDIVETSNPYDVALMDNLQPIDVNGKAVKQRLFFSVAKLQDPTQPVADPNQIRYTRNGNWQVNNNGYLLTADGYYVLDENNTAIRVNDPDPNGTGLSAGNKLVIDENGKLFLPSGDPNLPGEPLVPLGPTLSLKVATDPSQMNREGNNLYRWMGTAQPVELDRNDPAMKGFFGVKQGWVERSNVDPAQTMTDMMTALRAYEANQRVITTIDGTMDKAVNEIGRVNG